MKKLLLLGAAALMLSGCAVVSSHGSYSAVNLEENTTNSSFSMKYDLLNGTKQYTFKTNQDNEHLHMEFTTDSGILSVLVKGEDDTEYYNVEGITSKNEKIELGKSGTYTVDFTANNHKGGFAFQIKK